MKRIGITLLLLAMILAGCEKIDNAYDFVQSDIKSNIDKLLETKSGSEEPDSIQLELEVQDTNSVEIYDFPILNNPYSSSFPNSSYSPLRLDTTQKLGLFNYQNQFNTYSKPQWSMDSLNLSFKHSAFK